MTLTARWAALQVEGNSSRAYAQQIAQMMRGNTRADLKYPGMPALVVEYGREYKAGPRPEDLDVGKMGDCFMNAMRVAAYDSRYTYVEGYAQAKGLFPMHHAWLAKGAVAIDPTWEGADDYFGIPFTASFVQGRMRSTGMYGVFGDIPDEDMVSWMMEGFPPGAVKG